MLADPVLIAYTARRRKSGTGVSWVRIGKAFPHDRGAGLTLLLDALPIDGRIILLERDEADDRMLIRDAEMARKSGNRPRG